MRDQTLFGATLAAGLLLLTSSHAPADLEAMELDAATFAATAPNRTPSSATDLDVADLNVDNLYPPGLSRPRRNAPGSSTTTLSGTATFFDPACNRLGGGEIHVLEAPGLTTVTAEDGTFTLEGLIPGQEATLVLTRPYCHTTQLGTLVIEEDGIDDLTFQVPWKVVSRALAYMTGMDPDLKKCQVASTVTRLGYHPLPQCAEMGEPGATVTIDPPLPPDQGPVYFDEVTQPAPELLETTVDGGVLFIDVPPGEYTLRAHKEGVVFREVYVECRPGILVNASPPWGLQALEGGIGAE